MASAIYCKSGEDLGVTFMGHNDFQLTDDIIQSISALRENGVEFLDVPNTYYDSISDRIGM